MQLKKEEFFFFCYIYICSDLKVFAGCEQEKEREREIKEGRKDIKDKEEYDRNSNWMERERKKER